MVVRDFEVDTELVEDRTELLKLMLSPLSRGNLPKLPIPNLLTRTEHVQLGYPGWSLWALPLVAREAGLHLIRSNVFNTEVPELLRMLCADVFAIWALGPSYPCAVIYLDLDPDDTGNGGVSDPVRAEVLLDLLPKLGGEVQREALTNRANQLRAAWHQARAAVGGEDVKLAEDYQSVIDTFLAELRHEYKEIPYDSRRLAEVESMAQSLAAENPDQLLEVVPLTRDLLIAMWLARLDHGERSREIYARAKDLAARVAATGRPGQGRRLNPAEGRVP
jgi:hypothetical protein